MRTEPKKQRDPGELLEAFVASGRNETAFRELFADLGGLVHSSAWRRTGDTHLAEEVTQNVFALLARWAELLRRHPSLLAWIHETTRLQCADHAFVRGRGKPLTIS